MCRTRFSLVAAWCLLASLGLVAGAALAADPPETAKAPPPKDPYAAYDGGFYDQALSGFLDRQMSRPDEPRLNLAVGSAHYQMKSYDEARAAYAAAAQQGDPKLREQALYNLGNVAFRQGQLEEAVKLYQSALELDPNDQDAKHNLELTRNEIRRRLEEAKKRQEEQQQQQQQQGQQPQDQQQQQQQQQQGQEPQDQPQGDQNGEPRPGDEKPQGQAPEPSPDEQPGEQEQGGAEKQPEQSDPEQSDPEKIDEGQAGAQAQPDSLTPEQAAQLLEALSEGEPQKRQRGRPTRARGGKDW